MKLNSSVAGFLCSLCFHGALFGAIVYFFFDSDESANGYQAPISTHISMEMLKGMVKATPTPEIKPEPVEKKVVKPQPIPEVVKKEVVADPTVKKTQIKKKELKKEKPKKVKKEKPKKKTKPKPKVKKVQKKETRQGNKNVRSADKVNSAASNTSVANSNNPNLIGKGVNTDELSAYKTALRRAIERRKRYPQRAKLMRKQGTVIVAFSINKQGDLGNIHIAKSSGSGVLDKAAIKAVKGVRSIGPRPYGLKESLSIPINFKIN